MEAINKFYQNNMKLCLALDSWLKRNNKPFGVKTALQVIYDYCGGKSQMMADVITQMKDTMKKKVQGRSQVYHRDMSGVIDILPDENGQLTVVGYTADREAPLQGQHVIDDPKKTKSGAVSKTVRRSEDVLMDVGQRVREMYSDLSVEDIEKIMISIYNYAKRKKKSQMSIVDALENGKLRLTSDYQIKGKVNEGKTIFITEDIADIIGDEFEMTEYKFNSNVKQFLHDLLVDPVNADTTFLLKVNGFDRPRLLKLLIDSGIVEKMQKLSDKNKDGSFKTVTMKVKYRVPKKDFDHKLKKLFISQFEQNLGECTAAGAAVGGAGEGGSEGYQFSQPVFSGMVSQVGYNGHKKNNKKELDETSTADVGDYQYTVPFGGDKETLSRGDGIGGSTSMHRLK